HGLDFFAAGREAHATAPVPGQLIDVHRLGRLRRPTRVRVPSQSCRCADGQPVGRLIRSPPMLFRIDEALQQPRFETVSSGKVTPYPIQAHAQHLTGKILAVHLRSDEKTSHIDKPLLKALARRRIPSDPLIPYAQTQSTGTKSTGSQPPVVRADQITQLPAYQSA